jgi:GntR family transcriptional repressor for pyruvate dehydrogenase complex
MSFKPIKPKKAATQVADQIRSAIIGGELQPGEKLPSENRLAEMFGVSRPPVREALHALAAAGFVESYQGGGCVVKSLVETPAGASLFAVPKAQQKRALDVMEVRKCMGGCTAYFAAQRAFPDELLGLEAIVTAMEDNLGRLKPSRDLNVDFHTAIARATHNIVWLHLVQSMFTAMDEFLKRVWHAVYLSDEDHRTLYTHHRDVFEAIRDRNPDRARDAMLRHLTFVEQKSGIYLREAEE